jgi:hypothetical protein
MSEPTSADSAAPRDEATAAATARAEAEVLATVDRAEDNTPTKPGTEAIHASSGKVEHSKHPPNERAEDAVVAIEGGQQ